MFRDERVLDVNVSLLTSIFKNIIPLYKYAVYGTVFDLSNRKDVTGVQESVDVLLCV